MRAERQDSMKDLRLRIVRGATLSLVMWLAALSGWAQERSPADDAWARLQMLVGSWTGAETGMSGIGQGTRTYELVLGGKYLFQKNISRFKPQPRNPRGEEHRDWAFFSFDGVRKKIILREFHSEGFVNQYVLDDSGVKQGRFVFTSESLENSPPGWRARVTLRLDNPDALHETFELARPQQDFKPILENHWTREPSASSR